MPDPVSAATALPSMGWVAFFKRVSTGVVLLVILIGILVLVGWSLGIVFLVSFSATWGSMKPNTAVGLILAGFSLLLLQDPSTQFRRLGHACALLVAAMGIATFSEYVGGWNLGIDSVLFGGRDTAGIAYPGRMAPNTALSLAAIGLALFVLDVMVAGRYWPAQWLALAVGTSASLVFLGYLYGIPPFFRIASADAIPVHTALALMALALGVLCVRPYHGFMAVFCSDGAGGLLARRLLPGGIFIPFLLDWLGFKGVEAGWYDATFESVIHVVLVGLLLAILVLVTSSQLEMIDVKRRRTEQERTRALAELEGANNELEAFSYSVSHDLRSPLAAVKNFVQLVVSEHAGELSAEAREMLNLAARNAEEMDALIQGLLSLSRETRQPLNKETIHPAALVEAVIAELANEQTGRGVEFHIGELPPCQADPLLLKQVYRNLIANALKFTRTRAVAHIEIGAYTSQGKVVYYIKDNGVGFEPEQSGKLFGVFQRLHSADDYEGTGVGLAIVQRIVHRHGGQIRAEAHVGQGAVFSFTLNGV